MSDLLTGNLLTKHDRIATSFFWLLFPEGKVCEWLVFLAVKLGDKKETYAVRVPLTITSKLCSKSNFSLCYCTA